MQDQYEKTVPEDLVVLDLDLTELTPAQVKAIDGLDWYEAVDCTNFILVSWTALDKALQATSYGTFDPTDPLDADLDLAKGVNYIDHVLHRYNETDGWYHA